MLKPAAIRRLIEDWRNQSQTFKQGGRDYERHQNAAAARDCYGQSHVYKKCADELEQLLKSN